MKQRASASSLSSPPPKPTYPREESLAVGYPPHFCRRRDRHHRPSSRGRCFRFTPSRRSVFFSRSGPGAVSEVQLQHTRPLPTACARHRRRLASSGRLRSDWLEARVGRGMAAHGPLTEPEAPHPARPTERERRRTPEREATPSSFSSPASLYCVRRHQQPLSRLWETREEEEAAAVSPAGSLWPLRRLPPKGGAVRTNEPNRARLLLAAAATLPPPGCRISRLCGGQRFRLLAAFSSDPGGVPEIKSHRSVRDHHRVSFRFFGGSLPPKGQP
ncbi:uncharacterized protein PHA67_008220 [Liasis olivaceus]